MAENIKFEELQLSQQKVGVGSSGYVLQANWRDQEIAVKVYDLLYQKHRQTAEREIAQLSQIDHENIVKVYGSANDGGYGYLVMEYLEEGSLHNFLHGDDQREYTMEEAVSWARQCAEAMTYLHSMQPNPVMHRDIKPQNILFAETLSRLKICDFGSATDVATYLSNMKGTPAYMAPEVIQDEKYTTKCDIYSFGIMLWEMMSRQVPYSHLENPDNGWAVLEAVKKGARPLLDAVRGDCWEGIRKLIVRCWDPDPVRRPTAEQIAEYLGSLGGDFNYEDFILHLGDDILATVTFPKDPRGIRRIMRLEFWRRQERSIRLTIPILERETVRVGRVVGREAARVAEDVGREIPRAAKDGEREFRRAEKDAERETSRAAKDTEREVRRAEKDTERETSRAAKDTEREVRRAEKDMEREISRAAEDVGREVSRAAKDAGREIKQAGKHVEGAVRKLKKKLRF
ncbi:putative mitogen-activated protein kinase kinase kinase 7-like [Drosophila kikkawai]|uniref:Mitogen-activated protein kinase kinase kinase 7-like n=1 Tax=Drosophila kikkawai TaxID=30033 RepID=A0A6P4HNW5_DROKI|nr:putative mitogen-activated protein kinase kinase kinase 7-like [Drosophila kikkawai]